MAFDNDDPYITISCRILAVRPKAVQIEDDHGNICWCPRSCVHGGDDGLLDGSVGTEFELKIRRWFAEKEGLA